MNNQNNPGNLKANNESNSIDINEIIKPYLRKWPWFIVSALVAFIIGYISLKLMVPVYNTQSTVLIKDAKAQFLL